MIKWFFLDEAACFCYELGYTFNEVIVLESGKNIIDKMVYRKVENVNIQIMEVDKYAACRN